MVVWDDTFKFTVKYSAEKPPEKQNVGLLVLAGIVLAALSKKIKG